MKLPSPEINDVFLLFYELPFDFTGQLPLALGPGVCLDDTPWGLLNAVPPALADYILPGYHLRPSLRLNHCCLRSYDASIPHFRPDTLLFVSLSVLRLRAPLGIHIASSFTLGPTDNPISKCNPLSAHVALATPQRKALYSDRHQCGCRHCQPSDRDRQSELQAHHNCVSLFFPGGSEPLSILPALLSRAFRCLGGFVRPSR